jgi:ATP-dependent RNA helicase SUPV3L1/SUV3
LTSVAVDKTVPEAFYAASGFQVCGPRAIRIDMLERLADLIRPLTSWKPTAERPEPPAGAVGRGGFKIQPEMLSIIGCSSEEMGNVLFALGFRMERRPVTPKPAIAVAEAETAETAMADGQASAEAVSAAAESPASAAEPAVEAQAELSEPVESPDAAAEAAPEAVAAEPVAETPEAVGEQPAEQATEAAAPTDAEIVAETAAAAGDAEPAPAETAAAAGDAEPAPAETAAASADGEAAAEQAPAEPAAQAEPAEPDYEEIWRSRRRGQSDERRQSRRRQDQPRAAQPRNGKVQADGAQPAEKSAAPPDRGARPDRDRSKGGEGQRNDRRKPDRRHAGDKPSQDRPVTTASPPRQRGKQAAADKDSPFAALLELKERMTREAQDQA